MEAEVRAILVEAVTDSGGSESLFDSLRARIGALGGVELELPDRTAARLTDLLA